ncbi:rhodanese-like domain-containing protein [Phaeobacter sp. C3_T13_0]|uniref:rhodanese-like domain-containing protein n=1 Tax=Phaeobacter cretensis TaxID=3342641 RepID=UPI0039BC30D7
MTMSIINTSKELIGEAVVATTSLAQAANLHESDDSLFVDLRLVREVERTGVIPGALSCPRGLLGLWIAPTSPYHNTIFTENRAFVFYCDKGWRSALGARTAIEMGLQRVSILDGGFNAWASAGGASIPHKW